MFHVIFMSVGVILQCFELHGRTSSCSGTMFDVAPFRFRCTNNRGEKLDAREVSTRLACVHHHYSSAVVQERAAAGISFMCTFYILKTLTRKEQVKFSQIVFSSNLAYFLI